jgi:hypothetical protein
MFSESAVNFYFIYLIIFHQSIQKVHIKKKKKQFNNKTLKINTKTRWIAYAQGVKTPQNINVRHLCRTYTILYKKIICDIMREFRVFFSSLS